MVSRSKLIFYTFCAVLWASACFGFVSQELLPPLEKLQTPLFMLLDLAVVIMGLATIRSRKWILPIVIFLVLGFVSTVMVNHLGISRWLNGSRDFIPILFLPGIISWLLRNPRAPEFRASIDRQLYIFMVFQAVCITEQFLRYGANDHGGGSMGNGYSGIASILIVTLSFYFVRKNFDPDNYLRSIWQNRRYVLLMYPILLNETKVSFILVALYFLLLYRANLRSLGKITVAAPFLALVFVLMYSLYSSVTTVTEDERDDVASASYVKDYLFGVDFDEAVDNVENIVENDMIADVIVDRIDLPRFIKFAVMPAAVTKTAGGDWLGAGLGQYKGLGAGIGHSSSNPTKFYVEYRWFMEGTVTVLMYSYIQLGILGVIWLLYVCVNALDFRHNYGRMALKFKIYQAAVIVLIFLYNNALIKIIFCLIFFYITGVLSDKSAAVAERRRNNAAAGAAHSLPGKATV